MRILPSLWVVLVGVVLATTVSHSQTNPTPFALSSGQYSLTAWPASSPAGTYPPNMMFHRGPTGDPRLTDEPNADYTGPYNATTGTRMNGLEGDGFSWRNITGGDLGAAVLALNTLGVSNVRVSWTGGTVAIQNEREYRIRLQYRIGTSGPFTDVPGPVEYTSSTVGHSQNFGPTTLPANANNQPVVQLRWKYYYVSGTGNRPQLRVGNILVQSGELPGDGSGTARVSPDTLQGGITGPIRIIYRRDTSATINALRIFVPPAFAWSQNLADVSFTNMTATSSITGDTLTFSGISFSADSTVITIANVTSPDSTAIYRFRVQSKQIAFLDVTPTPRMVVFGIPVPIASVKENDSVGVAVRTGDLVTIVGVVTVANQFGGPSYVQDASGGLSVFTPAFHTAVQIGDEVRVSGVVTQFNGLNQIGTGGASPLPVYLHEIVSSGNSVTPLVVTCAQVANDGVAGVEEYEGLLVRLNAVTVTDLNGNPISTWTVSGSGTNYRLNDATGSVQIRVDNDVNFANTPAPQGQFDIIGVVSQFKPTAPFIGGYQIMPRFAADILASGPIIAVTPEEDNIQQTSMTISWGTIHPGTTRLRYGLTESYELGVVAPDDLLRTSHTLLLSGLQASTIYQTQAFSVAGGDTSFGPNLVVSTSSPAGSTGQMNVYFNRSVNTSVSIGEPALGNQDLVGRLVTRINGARRSIDAAIYSLSGSPGEAVAVALVNARNRGVRVRVICEYDNRNTTAFNILTSNGIPLIDDRFDPINNGAGLMHNKFFVIDYRGGAPESVWVWTGSWNLTPAQTTTDPQNSIEIQDVALAGGYTREFEEMWGSSTDVPNAANSRFGVRKRDNTPHKFVIDGKDVRLYFSPSDRSTTFIKNTLRRAHSDVAFSLFSFTRRDIADTLIARKNLGRRVRGVVDNGTPPEQYPYLVANGIDVHIAPMQWLHHHKYAIVDGTRGPTGPAWVVTGSQNWSNAGENTNNENTIIVQSTRVANLYLQEFAARYYEAGGSDSIVVGIGRDTPEGLPRSFSLEQNFPNPFNPSTSITFSLPSRVKVTLAIYNVLGQRVATLLDEERAPGVYREEFHVNHLASGVYFYRLQAGDQMAVRKMMLMK